MNSKRSLILLIFLTACFLQAGLSLPADRKKAEKHLKKAQRAYASLQFERMYKESLKVRAHDPYEARAYAYIGMYFYLKRDWEEAHRQLAASIEIDPNIAFPRAYLGNLLFEEGRMEEALEEWHSAARLDSSNSEAQASLALGYFLVGDQSKAIEHYKQALQWDKRYYNLEFLADKRKGAGWTQKKLEAVKPLLELVPAPRFRY